MLWTMSKLRMFLLPLLIFIAPFFGCTDKSSSIKYSGSNMEPTIKVGQTVEIDRSYYKTEPLNRNDIIVFRISDDPRTKNQDESKSEYISRVIAVSGDTVEVNKTTVKLNQTILNEEFAQWSKGGWKNFPETTVPEQSVFVLGDNRDFSRDSRFYFATFVRTNNIVGRVKLN